MHFNLVKSLTNFNKNSQKRKHLSNFTIESNVTAAFIVIYVCIYPSAVRELNKDESCPHCTCFSPDLAAAVVHIEFSTLETRFRMATQQLSIYLEISGITNQPRARPQNHSRLNSPCATRNVIYMQ